MMHRRRGVGRIAWARLDNRWGLLGLLLLLLQCLVANCGRSWAAEQLRTHLTASLLHNRLEPRHLRIEFRSIDHAQGRITNAGLGRLLLPLEHGQH